VETSRQSPLRPRRLRPIEIHPAGINLNVPF
jgi:hypothetical protein